MTSKQRTNPMTPPRRHVRIASLIACRAGRSIVRQRGEAMIETVLALPILLVFLMMLMYFGVASTRMHDTAVLARYDGMRADGSFRVAHEAASSDGSLRITISDTVLTPRTDSFDHINATFFSGRADDASVSRTGGASAADPADELIDQAAALSGGAGSLAAALHNSAGGINALPAATRSRATSSHDTLATQAFGQATTRDRTTDQHVEMRDVVAGNMSVTQTRRGSDWRYRSGYRVNVLTQSQLSSMGFTSVRFSDPNHLRLVNDATNSVVDLGATAITLRDDEYLDFWRPWGGSISVLGPTRDRYMTTFDQAMTGMAGPGSGNRLANTTRDFYLENPPYRGPTVFKPLPFVDWHNNVSIQHPGF